ncbi:cobalt-precorrin-6A reductase [Nonomuraea jiangxiensis]|uniref:Precorrin-6A/cobalt-precorrin-6A reductase n=1 Tax=Nonomuraea jiangxiensis TaxID=633440 RepID=A0A1G9G0X7_9ACTN|nr:cobalt-precorrin-6A reductase [Nonomuraea jiangxiensis]SDK94237.1 precorrin-6A/cobalt-precorrin-6A reductase [Nonomuraea jiangxiensis]
MRRVLILGGTAEARGLAGELAADPGLWVVSSLAGRVTNPRLPAGEVREGGFGGAAGLAAFLAEERIDVLVDATHPFAERMTASAAAASSATGVPLLVLRRPGWTEEPGDAWSRVGSLPAAADLLATGDWRRPTPRDEGRARVFLTTGRRSLALFASVPGVWLLARSVDPPEPPVPPNVHVLLDRGPYTVEGERALIREHRLDVLVTKDSGGPMTTAKLAAARQLGLPVIMVNRPPLPAGVRLADTVAAAVDWVHG